MATISIINATIIEAIPTELFCSPPHINEKIASRINPAIITNQRIKSFINFISSHISPAREFKQQSVLVP